MEMLLLLCSFLSDFLMMATEASQTIYHLKTIVYSKHNIALLSLTLYTIFKHHHMTYKPFYTLFFMFLGSLCAVFAQEKNQFKIHSHNDYEQTIPFWDAYGNGLNSIEADLFLKNDTLYVTHSEAEIKKTYTLEQLYLQPLEKAFSLELGTPRDLQLLLDIKSEAIPTLQKLVATLEQYPNLITNTSLSFVISGNRPAPELYAEYPDYIFFDHQNLEKPETPEGWDKVALISLPFQKYSQWNGKGRLTHADLEKVTQVIKEAHSLGKPFRFWGCPDSKTAWKVFADVGVDFINTDMPFKAMTYLSTLSNRVYYTTVTSTVYVPTYASDRKKTKVKNVILLIGDGNGLSQISSAVLANGGSLTLTQLKSIGFIKTQSADDFTTDSAAAGTALAVGVKTNNRAIGVNAENQPVENLTEILTAKGYNTGVITTDHITGATPGAFYAHQQDRDMVKSIGEDLLTSKLSLFVGGGRAEFTSDFFASHFSILEDLNQLAKEKSPRVGLFISEKGVPSVLKGRGNQLSQATKNGLTFLKEKNKPFFLMIEGAQIDSYGHRNETAGIVSEGIDFDRAVTEAIKFADNNANTLVIITADHETSGFSIPQGNVKSNMIEGDFTTDDHTATMVPIFAYGPHSDVFSGIYENTEVFHKILEVLAAK
jgi:alkaline phosphatase